MAGKYCYYWHGMDEKPVPKYSNATIDVLVRIKAKTYPNQTFYRVMTYSSTYGFLMCGYDREHYDVIRWTYIEEE